MGRALRIALWVAFAGMLVLTGVEVGVFMRMNDGWVTLRWPLPQASASFVTHLDYESPVWVLALGWVLAAALVGAAVLGLPIYLTRRRHVRGEIARLTRENAALRNLPITAPAPLEDLPAAAPPPAAPAPALEPEVGSDD